MVVVVALLLVLNQHKINDIANENKSKLVPELTNISFQIGSIYELPFDDDSFDLVHAHQVIIHLQNPIEALKIESDNLEDFMY